MNNLDEYVNKVLGKAFVYKKIKLGDIGKVCMCKRIMKDQTSSSGDVPFYKIGTFGKKADAFISRDLFNEYKRKYSYPKKGDILISCSGTIGRTVVFDGEDAYFQDSNIVWIDNDETVVLNTYLKYVYQLNPFHISTGGTISRLYSEGIEKAVIHVPSIKAQRIIVEILDNLSKATNELILRLSDELISRKKQHDYYRDFLFSFDQSTYKPIGAFARLCAGATPSTSKKEYWENGTIRWMSSGEVNLGEVFDTEKRITQLGYDNASTKLLPANTVVIALAGQGKTRGTVAITRVELCTNQSLCGIIADDTINPDYLRYFLQTQYMKLRDISSGDGTRGGLNLKMISAFEVPVPPLQQQNKIVSFLNVFDNYCGDLLSSLSAEIEGIHKQYEYYRDKLLTFKELEA